MTQYETRVVEGAFEEVLGQVRDQLDERGFRILYDVDARKRLEGHSGSDGHPRCRVLGVCDPRLPGRDRDDGFALGVLLSGRLVVCEGDEGSVFVGAVGPHPADSGDEPELETSTEQVGVRLARVLRSVAMEAEVLSE